MSDSIDNNTVATPAAKECMTLRTEGLVKRYGKRTVVNDVSCASGRDCGPARSQRSRKDHVVLYDDGAHRA